MKPTEPITGTEIRIMIVAGERSGDIYGAALAKALQARVPDVEIFGCGGDSMRQAGVDTVVDSHETAIAGITEIIEGYPRVFRAFHRLVNEVDRRRPQLAILIDFPDFNIRLAKKLKKRRIPVVYFISPQVWAWRKGRVKTLKKRIAKMIVIFDFEEDIYKQAGVPVEYVGHPLVGKVRPQASREGFFSGLGLDPAVRTVALLPGSREKEVIGNLPVMLEAAALLTAHHKLQFVIPVAATIDPRRIESSLKEFEARGITVRLAINATYDALAHSEVAVVTSGTATLEAALSERPMVVVYRVSGFTWFVGKLLVKVPHFSIVNILAKKALVPELMQEDFTAANVAARVEYLLDHAEARAAMVQGFRALKERLGKGGAIDRAAEAMLKVLESSRLGRDAC